MASSEIAATTSVMMTPEDIKLFLEFQKHYNLFEVLTIADAFSVKGGSVTMHFTNAGEIGSVDVQRRFRVVP